MSAGAYTRRCEANGDSHFMVDGEASARALTMAADVSGKRADTEIKAKPQLDDGDLLTRCLERPRDATTTLEGAAVGGGLPSQGNVDVRVSPFSLSASSAAPSVGTPTVAASCESVLCELLSNGSSSASGASSPLPGSPIPHRAIRGPPPALMEGMSSLHLSQINTSLGGGLHSHALAEATEQSPEYSAGTRNEEGGSPNGRLEISQSLPESAGLPPITLLGVNADLRRKRIKKVSNYILGPLLGEGAYGVVRDAINISGTPSAPLASTGSFSSRGQKVAQKQPCFERCAVKLIALPNKFPVAKTTALGRPNRQSGEGIVAPRSLSLCSRESRLRQMVESELDNLQRFHSKYLIRAHDVFCRYGRVYVVLPIALCSLEQLISKFEARTWSPQSQRYGASGGADLKANRAERDDSGSEAAVPVVQVNPSPFTDGNWQPAGATGMLEVTGTPMVFGGDDIAASQSSSHGDGNDDPYWSCGSVSSHTVTLAGSPPMYGSLGSRSHGGGPPKPLLMPESARYPIFSPIFIKGVFFQIVSGVAYLHEQHIAHNDLKPGNVLLFGDGTVKLTDLGSVGETFNDQGTPLYASPELCTQFYLAGSGNEHISRGPVNARANDMWCCGMLLYNLITGHPGPLPVHRYCSTEPSGTGLTTDSATAALASSAIPSNTSKGPATRYQLYRELALQKTPIQFDHIPDMALVAPAANGVERDEAGAAAASSGPYGYPPNGVRDLLSRLFDLNPAKRITATEVLAHPWVRMAFKPSKKAKGPLNRPPSVQAVEEAVQRDVARRVLLTEPVRGMIEMDNKRHLQFVADCCHTLGIPLPPEILCVPSREPFADEPQTRLEVQSPSDGVVTGTVVRCGIPTRMPAGCVDPDLFLPRSEADYYQVKSGKTEFDVQELRFSPMKVSQMQEYLHNVVLIQCGYRTARDTSYNATTAPKTRAASLPAHAGGHRVLPVSHTPSVVIQPGASGRTTGSPVRILTAQVPSPTPSDGGPVTPATAPVRGDTRLGTRRAAGLIWRPGGSTVRSNSSTTSAEPAMHESSKCFCGLM